MKRISLIALVLVAASNVLAQSLNYEVDLTNTASKAVKVTLRPQKLGAKKVTFQMPAWAPGAYSVTHYGRYVDDLKAFDKKGKSLLVKQISDDRWEITNGQTIDRIEYLVRDSHSDSTSLWFAMAHIDSALFFANGTALFGYVNDKKNVPATVTYRKLGTWEIATSMNYAEGKDRNCLFDQAKYKAANYDELVDSPVLASRDLQTSCFTQDGAKYEIAVMSQKPFPMDSLTEYTKRIVKTQTDFFGEIPYKHYTFLYYNPTYQNMPGFSQGALEHNNSSAYLLVNLPWEAFKGFGLRVISHEFFHLWNVKRIHSTLLGPFDYTQGVKTSSLWLSEGITDYYAHALLSRNGIITPQEFLNEVKGWHFQYRTSKPARTKSLEELSREESEFIMENAITLYTKGPLVGMMLDAEIRTRTNNQKSLDDVMLALNADAKKGKNFKDEELIGKIGKIVGLDLSDFYKRYITGADSIDLEQQLNKLGLTSKVDYRADFGTTRAIKTANGVVYTELPASSILARAGVSVGDTVLTVNDQPATEENILRITQDFADEIVSLQLKSKENKDVSLRFTPSRLPEKNTDKMNITFSDDGKMVLNAIPEESFLRDAGLREGDVLVSVNGVEISPQNLGQLLGVANAQDEQVIIVRRIDGEHTIRFNPQVLAQRHSNAPAPPKGFHPLKDQTPLQIAVRNGIMGRLAE